VRRLPSREMGTFVGLVILSYFRLPGFRYRKTLAGFAGDHPRLAGNIFRPPCCLRRRWAFLADVHVAEEWWSRTLLGSALTYDRFLGLSSPAFRFCSSAPNQVVARG